MPYRDDRYLAELLNVANKTPRAWRLRKPPFGPKFIRISHKIVRYSDEDIAAWLAEQNNLSKLAPTAKQRRKRRTAAQRKRQRARS